MNYYMELKQSISMSDADGPSKRLSSGLNRDAYWQGFKYSGQFILVRLTREYHCEIQCLCSSRVRYCRRTSCAKW
jgi:hypothetical protein